MKVRYISILLFALPLNILVNTHKRNPSITPSHALISRLLCECELYAPVNYDNDPQMKAVMENFSKQTQERFHEYVERLQSKRMQCKDKCDKEIQKIILKDKLEKELMDKFATLQTDIKSDAIRTYICEKSVADKTENFCLKCGYGLGSVAPSVGILGGIGIYGWIKGAPAVAAAAAKEAGIQAGVNAVIEHIKRISIFTTYLKDVEWSKYITKLNYDNVSGLMKAANSAVASTGNTCPIKSGDLGIVCDTISNGVARFGPAVSEGAEATTNTTATVYKAALDTIESTTTTCTTAITASVVAIVVIVLIMVIIYLILRYRRKKKMKKKLQYIKLLKE
ncbi:rifin PIR protein, putative [Plasmodium reichenowi]|uniref:Rifin PIR protein, putative n=1 Tax=Plasmodium reichenowi TaxID=5854 RepID=A0A2P9D9N6_PLARE|nr:rifin PIR protein, putative [Plasmodium reichenowi]